MKITDIKIHPVASERRYVTQIARSGRQLGEERERSYYLILEISTDEGLAGFGEASDINRIPDLAEATLNLKSVLLDQSPFNTEFLLGSLKAPSFLACAVDLALHDLQGKYLSRPVYDLLGGRVIDKVLASWVIYIRGTENLGDEITQKLDLGFRAFKMKVGADLDLDEKRLQLFRDTAGDAEIKIDANGAWNVEQAVEAMSRLSQYDVAGIETPVPADDVNRMLEVKKRISVPYIEHGGTSSRHLEMVQKGAVDAFKVSVCSGGLRRAKTIAALAASGNVACYVGSTVEMGPGTAAGIHFAASTNNTDHYGADLRGPLLLKDDVLSPPIDYRDGYLSVPDSPGLGVEVDRDKLENLRFDPSEVTE